MNAQPDYFSALGLAPCFDIDLADLEKRYFLTQREFHPDRMVGKSTHARTLAISHSMLLNTAYETLKSPLKRSQYLLSLQGVKPDTVKPSQALLVETMELREQLAEAGTRAELASLEAQNSEDIARITQEISAAFRENKHMQAGELSIRLSYLAKMSEEIRAKKKHLPQ